MNPLCARLGIDVPILQSGMSGVAGPDLAAAVSNAGGLGILSALLTPPDALRAQIEALRSRTQRPFAVNLWLHDELMPPEQPDALDTALVDRVQGTLNELRSGWGLAPHDGAPSPIPDLLGAALDVMVDARIPIFSAGVGLPSAELVERFHRVGTTVMAMVVDVDDAREALDRGVDILVAQGAEAGGHRSVGTKRDQPSARGLGTIVLVPAIRDAIGPDVLLAAAGGIADARGIAAALMLGANGVLLGTRFVATAESAAHPAWKEALLARDRPTVLTDAVTGQWARALRNEYIERYDEAAPGTLPSLLQYSAAADIFAAAGSRGEPEMMPMWAGDSSRLIDDVSPVAAVMAELVAGAEAALGRPLNA